MNTGLPQITITIPPYLCTWDIDEAIRKCERHMYERETVYGLDMSGVRNVYSATVRLISHLNNRALRLNAKTCIINASAEVINALCALKVHHGVPIAGLVMEEEPEAVAV